MTNEKPAKFSEWSEQLRRAQAGIVTDGDPIRPESLVLYGRSYTIPDIGEMMSKNGFLACTEYVNGTIYMSSAMDQALWLKTLIHEVTHVAQQEVGRESSEEEANWAAVFVHDLLVNNPEVALAYLELAGWTEPFDEESAGEDDAKGS